MKLSEALEIIANSEVDDIYVTVYGYGNEDARRVFLEAMDEVYDAAICYLEEHPEVEVSQ